MVPCSQELLGQRSQMLTESLLPLRGVGINKAGAKPWPRPTIDGSIGVVDNGVRIFGGIALGNVWIPAVGMRTIAKLSPWQPGHSSVHNQRHSGCVILYRNRQAVTNSPKS